jgi:hypothetical protein
MSETPEHEALPRRLTQAQIIGMLLTRGSREHSSVTLSRNAKGETQIEVVVRTGESDEVVTVDDAAAKADATYDRLRRRYPTASGHVGAPPAGDS